MQDRTIASVLAVLVLIGQPASAQPTVPAYLADTSRAGEGRVTLTLEIPETLRPKPVRVAARSLTIGSDSQIDEVACDGLPLRPAGTGWALTDDCRRVTWVVALERAGQDIAADDQSGIFFGSDWGFLPDTAFLRPDGWAGQADVRIVHGTVVRDEVLPALDSAPALFLVGQPPMVEMTDGRTELVYIGNRLDEVLARLSPHQHLAGLSYLRAVTGSTGTAEAHRFTVVWLPALRGKRGLGGAAGADAMLVNYYPDSEHPDGQEALMPFVILLHEQFHQIAPGGLPLWATESLAQYFALKAATRTAPDGRAIAQLWDRLASIRSGTPGLLEVQRQVLEQGDATNYGLFYDKGAMFWHELDLAMQNASTDAVTLDAIMPQVFDSGFDSGGNLSASLRASLPPIPEGELERLIKRYLT